MGAYRDIFLDCSDLDSEQCSYLGIEFSRWQRDCNWYIGDLARYAKNVLKLGDNYSQVFPEWISPGQIQRCEAVAAAYPNEEDRNPLASWTIHMREANRPDRIARVQAHVDAGRTSDEARQADKEERDQGGKPRWLLCVDVSYFLHHTWFSGAGVESAVSVSLWVQRTVERLKEKGLTDVVCCIDSRTNHRKEFTAEWDDKYKDRPPRDPELSNQLNLVHELLRGHGFACVTIEGMEADDIMASYAKQFAGRVTLLTPDKDLRQCLSEKCNMLLGVEWITEELTGDVLAIDTWYTARLDPEKPCRNLFDETGLTPAQWIEFQAIMGDATDGIKGVVGVGAKGAADLVKAYGTVEKAIKAAKDGDPAIPEKKRLALLEFESKADVTRKLVTLRNDLPVPNGTRIP